VVTKWTLQQGKCRQTLSKKKGRNPRVIIGDWRILDRIGKPCKSPMTPAFTAITRVQIPSGTPNESTFRNCNRPGSRSGQLWSARAAKRFNARIRGVRFCRIYHRSSSWPGM
jgi:hypothetical protein